MTPTIRVFGIKWESDDPPRSLSLEIPEGWEGSFDSFVESEIHGRFEEKPTEFSWRLAEPQRSVDVVSYTIGFVEKVYGGPEEGGWYYDWYSPTRVFHVSKKRAARLERLLQRFVDQYNEGRPSLSSVLSTGLGFLHRGITEETQRQFYS